jgi:predicted dinucleotide-binding enzyme
MFVDTNAISALGTDCSAHADDLSSAAAVLKSLPGAGAAAAFGPVGAGFLAALADAVETEMRAVLTLGDDLASAQSVTGVVAQAYSDADRRGSQLL